MVTFCGSCSKTNKKSGKNSSGRQFRSSLAFPLGPNMSLSMNSLLYIEETGLLYKRNARVFVGTDYLPPLFLTLDSSSDSSDSDSSVHYEDILVSALQDL